MIINVTKKVAKILPKEWLLENQDLVPRYEFSDWHMNAYWYGSNQRPLFVLMNNKSLLAAAFYNKAKMDVVDFQKGILGSISMSLGNVISPLEDPVTALNKYINYAQLPIHFVAKTDHKIMGHMREVDLIINNELYDKRAKINKREILQPDFDVITSINGMLKTGFEKKYITPQEEVIKLLRQL